MKQITRILLLSILFVAAKFQAQTDYKFAYLKSDEYKLSLDEMDQLLPGDGYKSRYERTEALNKNMQHELRDYNEFTKKELVEALTEKNHFKMGPEVGEEIVYKEREKEFDSWSAEEKKQKFDTYRRRLAQEFNDMNVQLNREYKYLEEKSRAKIDKKYKEAYEKIASQHIIFLDFDDCYFLNTKVPNGISLLKKELGLVKNSTVILQEIPSTEIAYIDLNVIYEQYPDVVKKYEESNALLNIYNQSGNLSDQERSTYEKLSKEINAHSAKIKSQVQDIAKTNKYSLVTNKAAFQAEVAILFSDITQQVLAKMKKK
ncbi:hypothetical protein [Chryseobacterium sp.]|uniref:hypothetical protein n=1 Tax=Chryseobacterium sp. TaxID=1871047 RepID=UPI002FCA0058